jgi:hypothetical protein
MLSNSLNFYLPKKQSLLRKLYIFIKHINKVFCTPGLPTVVP